MSAELQAALERLPVLRLTGAMLDEVQPLAAADFDTNAEHFMVDYDEWDEFVRLEDVRALASTSIDGVSDRIKPENERQAIAHHQAWQAGYAAGRTARDGVSGTGLEDAWREAEAALPEGWRAWGLTALPGSVTAFVHGRDAYRSEDNPTPEAALRALRAALAKDSPSRA